MLVPLTYFSPQPDAMSLAMRLPIRQILIPIRDGLRRREPLQRYHKVDQRYGDRRAQGCGNRRSHKEHVNPARRSPPAPQTDQQ